MWLYVRQSVSDYDFEGSKKQTKELDNILSSVGWTRDEIDEPQAYVELPVVYWRKANAIHGWFITHLTDGNDECQPIRVTKELLAELRDTAKQVLSMRDDVMGEEKANLYLPPMPGFFFGSTNIDEYYYKDLEYTIEELDRVLSKVKDDDWTTSFRYQASW